MKKNWIEQPDIEFSITWDGLDDAKKVLRDLSFLGLDKRNKIFKVGLRAALTSMRKEAVRVARTTYTARPSKLFEHMDIDYAEGELRLRGPFGMNLFHFKPFPNTPKVRPKGGVTSKVKRKGKRYAHRDPDYDHNAPFVMKKLRGSDDGGYGIFVKEKDGNNKPTPRMKGVGRLGSYWGNMGLHMLFGPSPIQALLRKDNQELVLEKGTEAFRENIEQQIDKLLAAAGRR